MKKIVITGASGFVGSNLCEYLNNNFEIIPVGRTSLINYNNFSTLNYDIIIHLAGKAHDLKNTSNADEYYKINFGLTKIIFDKFLNSQADTFIYMSSVKAVADKVCHVLTENVEPHPQTHYGKSKLLAEKYILSKVPADKRVFILRPCIIHGQGNKGNLTLLYNLISKGIPYPLGAFENMRSFLSIENLCFMVKNLILKSSIKSDIFNLADNEAISTNELIMLINESQDRKVPIWKVSQKLIRFIAKVGDFLPFPLNTERLNKLTENYVVSNEKICKIINEPLPNTTKQGLLKTFSTFK